MSKIVVADLYQLGRNGEAYDKTMKKLVNKGRVILRSYAERINANTASSGKMYVIDEQATKEWHAKSKSVRGNEKPAPASAPATNNASLNASKLEDLKDEKIKLEARYVDEKDPVEAEKIESRLNAIETEMKDLLTP